MPQTLNVKTHLRREKHSKPLQQTMLVASFRMWTVPPAQRASVRANSFVCDAPSVQNTLRLLQDTLSSISTQMPLF